MSQMKVFFTFVCLAENIRQWTCDNKDNEDSISVANINLYPLLHPCSPRFLHRLQVKSRYKYLEFMNASS